MASVGLSVMVSVSSGVWGVAEVCYYFVWGVSVSFDGEE